MSVKLKTETLKNGRKSFYLDIYINKDNFKRKGLKLYLIPEKNNKDKELNKKIRRLAEQIRNQYEAKLLEEKYNLNDPRSKYNFSFMVYFEKLVTQRYESGTRFDSWRSARNYLKS